MELWNVLYVIVVVTKWANKKAPKAKPEKGTILWRMYVFVSFSS